MNLPSDAESLINKWLIGAIFIGFRFGSNFTLLFDRQSESRYGDRILPWHIKLDLFESWFFGDKTEWLKRVQKNGQGVEPDEPVKSFELTKLRWSEGAVVSSVLADDTKLILGFENGTTINVQLSEVDEYAYSIKENRESDHNVEEWSITLDEEGIFVNTP